MTASVPQLAPGRGRRKIFGKQAAAFLASLREHSILIVLILLHLLVGAAMPWLLHRDLHFAIEIGPTVESLATLTLWCVLVAACVGVSVAALRRAEGGPLSAAGRWLCVDFLRPSRIWGGVIFLSLFPIFAWNFAFLEALIPILHKFDWDTTFAAWDRWLHFGRQPWEWLQPVFGFPIVTSALSFAYGGWFLVLYIMTIWQAFSRRDPVLRMQYLITSVLIWILIGNLFGTLLASAGPEYFGRITGLPDPFAPLMDYLRAADKVWPVYTVHLQEKMWRLYLVNGNAGVIDGSVAAMPSLHVATAFSFYLVGRAMYRILGWILGCFVVVTLVATVHLGWHYAIDGYAGLAGTWVLWWACGRILRWPKIHRMLWGAAPPVCHAPAAGDRSDSLSLR